MNGYKRFCTASDSSLFVYSLKPKFIKTHLKRHSVQKSIVIEGGYMKNMKKNFIFSILITTFFSLNMSWGANICPQYLEGNPSLPSIEDVFKSGAKIIPLVFSVPTEKSNNVVKKLTKAWALQGYSTNRLDSPILKIIVLDKTSLIFAKTDYKIYKNIIQKEQPHILEISKDYLVASGVLAHSSKVTPELLQVFSHIQEDHIQIPSTILFPMDIEDKINIHKILNALGITDFESVGESVFANITKKQFDLLANLPEVEQIGLQF